MAEDRERLEVRACLFAAALSTPQTGGTLGREGENSRLPYGFGLDL